MKKITNKIKMPKDIGWLLPGLKVKRWFGLIFLGAIFLILGFCVVFNMEPVYYIAGFLKQVAVAINQDILGIIFLVVGAYIFVLGWKNSNYSILDLNEERGRHAILESLYKRRKLNYGPKIVAVGGGTGLSTMLKGIKKITNNITAVVTVGDDGGSSGRLRQEMGVLPPGDIRNCIAALADDEDLVTKLFQFRFNTGEGLEGHSFGNLFLSALCSITGNMVKAVQVSSKVLNIRGVVLPSTLDDMKLSAEMVDGTIVDGESNIPEIGKRIKRLFTTPEKCKALPDVIKAINDADLIILGPGSLYTSVIPNLLIPEISQAISKSNAKKIYVCNIMTQPGETTEYSASEHINAILEHAGVPNLIDAVLVNKNLPLDLSPEYEKSNSYPVVIDVENIKSKGINVVKAILYEENEQQFVRHSPSKLARAISYWYKKALKDKKS